MWNPVSSSFEASSVPRGPRKRFMFNERKIAAPAWNDAVSSFIDHDPGLLCAEDAVEFNVESSEGSGVQNGRCM